MPSLTMAQAFDAAIAAEHAAEQLFRGLQAKFAAQPDLVDFWGHYAEEEVHHAAYLSRLLARQSPQDLARPADQEATALIEAVSKLHITKVLSEIHNLEEAYQVVNDLESGETNAIFLFILNNFETDSSMAKFLRAQLSAHVSQLSLDLPPQYHGSAARLAIPAID